MKYFKTLFIFHFFNLDLTQHFSNYVKNKLNLSLPVSKKKVTDIFQHTAGNPWLIKEIFRQFSENTTLGLDKILESELFLAKSKAVWNSVLKTYREQLANFYFNRTRIDEDSLSHLKKLGYFLDDSLEVSLFFQKQIAKSSQKIISLVNDIILVNGVNVTQLFSKSELLALSLLLQKNKDIISKDEMIDGVWGENSKTDWAVDKFISRLKKKLSSIGFSEDILKTYRKRGYTFNKSI